jgi:hypothetical protein
MGDISNRCGKPIRTFPASAHNHALNRSDSLFETVAKPYSLNTKPERPALTVRNVHKADMEKGVID